MRASSCQFLVSGSADTKRVNNHGTAATIKIETDIDHEGHEEHEVKKFEDINFGILRVLRGEYIFESVMES
jgi:hypothetical protein